MIYINISLIVFLTDKNGKCTSLYVTEYYYKADTSIHGESTYAVELD